ncbi:MAG: methyltransferase domain-containing protein [candidate division Zixibacteria bacterium]|nr:methyltransferase domain-containing protein [candidate division Zixibacteria bacterium]
MAKDNDYVLGTHDEEIQRLGLQHRVWRPRALDAWRRAGFTVGQTLMDVGCGPGYASLDLAGIVGPAGHIIACDRSRRFLDALEAARDHLGIDNITTHELDLSEAALPASGLDGAWCRWVFAFVKNPRSLLSRVAAAIRPGGVAVFHEYFNYASWRFTPRSSELEEFVQAAMKSWRADGGEPDIGLDLPVWLRELGFEIDTLKPIIDVVPATNFVWQWPVTFVEVALHRLVDLKHLTPERSHAISKALADATADPRTLMVTPAVLEIIAHKR